MHQSSLDKMLSFRKDYLTRKERESLVILDLGSQDVNGSYRNIFQCMTWKYIGIDMAEGPNVDIVLKDPYCWKEIKSSSADVIISGQTLEHVEYFWITILEIARVLKPGGLCCIIAPASGVEHRHPVDCWRFYSDGVRALAKYARLKPLSISTQWDDLKYPDGSDIWKDTMLVCRKDILTRVEHFKERIRRRMHHYFLRLSL